MGQHQGMPGPAWDGISVSLMHLTKPGGPTSSGTPGAGEPHRAPATRTAATEARFVRFDFSRALNQSCFLNKAREELALREIPGSQRSGSSPGDQTADKSEQTVHPQPCGADRASVPGCPASLALPPRLLLSQARCSPLQLQPLSTLQMGKTPAFPCVCRAGAQSIYLMVCSK